MIISRTRYRKGIILLLLLTLSGCVGLDGVWIMNGPDIVKDPPPLAVPAEPTPEAGKQGNNVEILWQVPNEAVENYHIYLLGKAGEEKRHYKVPVGKLSKRDHPTFGPVYSYVLPNTLKSDLSSITIRAENKFGMSEASEPKIVGE